MAAKGRAMAYVGRAECGHIVFATVDYEDRKKETARAVAKAIRDGLTVERMTVTAVRQSADQWCPAECQQGGR